MKLLVLIPARSGSKRLIGKNRRVLGNKSLIDWTIDFASELPGVKDVLLTSDDEIILDSVKKKDILVPWIRPPDLSTDKASAAEVAIHALDWYEEKFGTVDCLLLLQPTSPFRRVSDFNRGIELFIEYGMKSVVSVGECSSHPAWTFKIDGKYMEPYLEIQSKSIRYQDLPKAYSLNGAYYFTSPKDLRMTKSFLQEKTIPLIINGAAFNLDIDNQDDLDYASYLLSKLDLGVFKLVE